MKKLVLLFSVITLMSCNKEEKQDAVVHYYFSATDHSDIDEVYFNFNYARAIREDQNEARTIYLDPLEVVLNTNNPEQIFLGTSEIESEQEINGYDFGLDNFIVVSAGDTLHLTEPYAYDNYASFDFTPSSSTELNVNFTLDMESLVVLDSAGKNWIKPRISVKL